MSKPFPGFERLYELGDPVANRPYRGGFDHDAAFELSRGETTVRRPVEVTWAMGASAPGDVIWTTSAHPLIVSSRVVSLLHTSKLTGWKTYPVVVFDKQGRKRPGYVGLAVIGRCGRIKLAKSHVIVQKYPAGYFPHFIGHFFDTSSWDGSDFCVDRPDSRGKSSMTRIVTEEVVALLQRNRISNVLCERLTEVSVATDVFEIGSRYLLPTDFQSRVASAYRAAGKAPPRLGR